MKDYKKFFNGKKVTVMGLGLLGRGVGDVGFLADCGAELIVTDKKSEAELESSLDQLKYYTGITYVLGEHRFEDFEGRDMILVSAGVPFDSPYILHARKHEFPLFQSGALFEYLSEVPTIGVTGTRGKSTVTHMIHHVLSEVTGEKIILGGNVRGVSNLQLLNEVKEDSLAVMELDSWQLQGFGWMKISPQVAVFTTFMEDHMNYYKGDMNAYFADKANIFQYQDGSGVLVTTHEVFAHAEAYMKAKNDNLDQEIRLADVSIIPDELTLRMPGEHNRLNAALAYEALIATGLEEEEILHGLSTFPGIPGRLEYLGDIKGVRVYNDNNATTPRATITGLKAVGGVQNVILIAGGAYKEVDPSPLIPVIDEYCKKVVLLSGTGTDMLKDKIDATITHSLKEAVELALQNTESGDVLLFSPAFASFGMFKNEYDRNDQFVDIIKSYET